MQGLTRRRLLKGALTATISAAVLPLVTACSSAPSPAPTAATGQADKAAPSAAGQQPGALRVMMNGGKPGEWMKKAFIEPFEKANNARVEIIPALSAEMYTRLKAEQSAPTVDVVVWDDLVAVGGRSEELVEKIDAGEVPNLKDLKPEWDYKDGYGPAVYNNAQVIAYNTGLLKDEPPKSFKELWDPRFKGKLMMGSINVSSGMLMLVHSALTNGGSYENIEPGFEALKTLRPNIVKFFNTIAEIQPALLNEPVFLVTGMNNVQPLINEGKELRGVFPAEGAFSLPAVVDIVKGTKAKGLAHKLVNTFMDAEGQSVYAQNVYMAVSNAKAPIPADFANKIPSKVIIFDPYKITKYRQDWAARWKREIG